MAFKLKAKRVLLAGIFFAGFWLLGRGASAAAVNLGLTPEVGEALGLGTADIRVTVAVIIRNFMALLGIVAVALILYGGWLWMSSQGEETQIEKAKKVIISAAIGLAIVLASVAIAQFVLKALGEATGIGGGTGFGGAGGGGGNLPPGSFYIQDISPAAAVPIRNVVVRIIFSLPVDAATAGSNVAVIGPNGSVSGSISTNGDLIEFEPSSACPDPNGSLKCFDANTSYTVVVSSGLKGYQGQNLLCGGLAPPCSASFQTGDQVDVTAPDPVAITSPDDGQSLPEAVLVPVQVHAVDDVAISYIEAFADGGALGKASPGGIVKDFLGTVNWDKNITLGDHSLTAQAHDIDKHLGSSGAVSVVVRPIHCFNKKQDVDETGLDCGGSCGACAGGACSKNSDCASGLCIGGMCVDRPRIDAVTPIDQAKRPNGAPGTLVTISGAFFGSSVGKVVFFGSSSSTAKEAELCDSAAWSADEITVKVPKDAIDGPIIVTATNGQSDMTSDDRGPLINDFDVNGADHPGICNLSPNHGEFGAAVTAAGSGFGQEQGSGNVFFRVGVADTSVGKLNAALWSETAINFNVPTFGIMSATPSLVRLNQNGRDSNSKGFLIEPLGAGKAPRIDAIDPGSGPVGRYLTILGQNFGSNIGSVLFSLPDQTTALADTSFPDACATDFWKDKSIVVKVPAYYKDNKTPVQELMHSVRVKRADTVESNTMPFAVTTGAPGPGLCALVPDNGPASTTKVDALGERFGTITGNLRFGGGVNATNFTAWNDQQIVKALVPPAAQTGLVRVVSAAKVESNGLNFLVGACASDNQCGAGYSCCADGSCRKSCAGVALAGGFAWRFSTGDIPKLPQMIEEQLCKDTTQSPTPWRGSRDACVNAVVSGRVSANMNDASLITNVYVYKCGAGADFDPSTCDREKTLPKKAETIITPVGSDQDMFTYTPVSLDPGTWYEVVVRSNPTTSTPFGAQSVDGLYLDGDFDWVEGGDYIWRFRTRDDPTVCLVDHLEVTPPDFLMTQKNQLTNYRADPTAANCNLLECSAYNWNWRSELTDQLKSPGDSYAPLSVIAGQPLCMRRATALKETPAGTPLHEIATIPEFQVSDYGNLAISFLKPEVVEYWPSCNGACVNSGIGARWNIGMNQQSLNKQNIFVCECTEESCTTLTNCSDKNSDVTIVFGAAKQNDAGESFVDEVGIQGYGPLKKQTWYRAMIRGGATGVKSLNGSGLVSLNYGPGYSWKFRTRNDASLCEVDSVSVEPKNGAVYIFGDVLNYLAKPRSKGDDKCGPTPLDSLQYNWIWSAANKSALELPDIGKAQLSSNVATLDFQGKKDFWPLKDGPGCTAICLMAGSATGGAICGNGKIEIGEDCDDGNLAKNDGCSDVCLSEGSTGGAICGNGLVERGVPGQAVGPRGENCDDGNTINGDGCSSRCLAEGSAFGASECGNGKIDKGENCDDGNAATGDGCSDHCLLEGSLLGKAVCGNGKIEAGEACDDGNANSGDGCSDKCLKEGADTAPGCGNGKIQKGESCDDGNTASGDGCRSICVLEGTKACEKKSQLNCCGNGTKDSSEECDAGILDDKNAGCSAATCLWTGRPACEKPGPNSPNLNCCGNSKLEPGESCDDGNLNGGDGCSSKCLVEGTPVYSVCGNKITERDEACDDGNAASGDGCSAYCLNEGSAGPHAVCGNAIVDEGEDCDDGNTINGDGCSATCLAEGTDICFGTKQTTCCGNGKVEVGENCDDGNSASGDGCSGNCLAEGSSARYNIVGKTSSYCGFKGDVVPPAKFGTGEMCEYKKSGDGNSDPSQFVRASFGGEAEIKAGVINPSNKTEVNGKAAFTLVCQCTNDSSCSNIVPALSQPQQGVGCGLGKCCYGRPIVLETDPKNNDTNICRNTLIAARFDRIMDSKTFATNTLLLVQKPKGGCPKDQDLPMQSNLSEVNSGYCLAAPTSTVFYSVSGLEVPLKHGGQTAEAESNIVTELQVKLTRPLEPEKRYAVLLYGDHNLADDVTEGVASAAKVAMNGDYLWRFTTGKEICQIDHTAIQPERWLFSTAQNDPTDDAGPLYDAIPDNDKQFVSEAWTKRSGGELEKIQPVAGYSWEWSWKSSDEKEERIYKPKDGNTDKQWLMTVPSPKNGETTVVAVASVTENVLGAICKDDPDCGAKGKCLKVSGSNEKRCAGNIYAAQSMITVFICENPWPKRDPYGNWSPFTDSATNFSAFYCRDQGATGTDDDLPAPVTDQPIAVSHTEKVCSNNVAKACVSSLEDCGVNAICQPKYLRDLLFPLNCPNNLCSSGDAFGFRVVPNQEHQEIKRWYALQGFSGSPAMSSVDGYEAISDGRTMYVSAANKVGDPDIYTNVYILSYNEGASQNTKKIAQSLIANWSFNTNLISTGICAQNVCSGDTAKVCVSNNDCSDSKSACGPQVCTSDNDCSGAVKLCYAVKDKLQRDMRRFVDFRTIESSLEAYRTANLRCSKSTAKACLIDSNCPSGEHCLGDYPQLASGSFIRGMSVSTWDSWQSALGAAIGAGTMPTDPLNTLACRKDQGFEAPACFNNANTTFKCEAGSHAYQYKKTGKSYSLLADFEYRVCSNDDKKLCLSDDDCKEELPHGICDVPVWKGIGPSTHIEYDDANNAYTIQNSWGISGSCVGTVQGGTASLCGDGVVGPNEECEPGQSKLVQCVKSNYSGFSTVQCVASGPNACRFGPALDCSAGFCGDGIVQTNEACDDGGANGTYGHCEVDCKRPALAGHCGDGIIQGVEICDFGGHCKLKSETNCAKDSDCGANDWCVGKDFYSDLPLGKHCGFDCQSFGPLCGDLVTQPEYGEECDGNQQIDTDYCPVCPDPKTMTSIQKLDPRYQNCTEATIGRKQVRARNCAKGTELKSECSDTKQGGVNLPLNICPRCGWLDWGACSPSGICGDGVTDKGEECDDGNDDNNDGCIIVRKYNSQTKRMELDPANSCKKALCGDGYVWSGNETCDTGAKNINPSDKKSIQNVSNNCPYGKICNFCTTACKPSSVSGGYCGDLHVTPSYEICEPGLGKGNYGGDQALMSKYPGVEQICYPNCQAWCPTTFQKIPNLKLTSSPWTPNYVDQVDNFLSGDEWFIALPPCRYLEGISMDVNFQKVKLPDTMVMIVMDTSKGMDDIYSAAQIKKIDLAKQFVSDLIKAFDDQFVSFPNSLHIGVLTTPPLSGKKLRFYEDADFKACEAANNCCTEKWANETDEKYSVEDGAFKAKMDDNGFCWMQITKSNIDRTRCVYQCRVESTIRSPYGLNDPNKWFVRPNAPGEMNNLQSMVSGKIKTVDNQDYFDLWEAVDMAAGILDTAQSTKRIIVVVSGDETKEIFCGGQQSGPPFPRSYPTYVLHLQNNFGLGSCLSEYPLLGQTWYGYGYTEAQSLVQSIFAGTSVLNLTFNGKKTQIPLTGDINLDTAGIQCGNKENRLPIKLDWGGGGSAQIKNVTPSYCPLFP